MAIEVDHKTGEILADSVAAPGIIKDEYGHEWTIPTDELATDDIASNPLNLPTTDPKFFYEFVREDLVQGKSTEGFVLVDRKEVGVEAPVTSADLGGPETSYHRVHDLYLMKIPRVLADRRYRAQTRMVNDATAQITDQKRLATAGRENRVMTASPEPFEAEVTNHESNFVEPQGSARPVRTP